MIQPDTQLEVDLLRDEGFRLTAYPDSGGLTTIGVGHNLMAHPEAGFGAETPITEAQAHQWLKDDIAVAEYALDQHLPWWRMMTLGRQRALANMCFQLGWSGLARFRTTLGYLERGEYEQAAESALQSLWARQVPARAKRVTDLIRHG